MDENRVAVDEGSSSIVKKEPEEFLSECEDELASGVHSPGEEGPQDFISKVECEEEDNIAASLQICTEEEIHDECQDYCEEASKLSSDKSKEVISQLPNKVKSGKRRTGSKKCKQQAPHETSVKDSIIPSFSSLMEPNDIIIKPESVLECPSSLQSYSEEEIANAFNKCFHKRSNLKYIPANSMFGKIFTFLTQTNSSTMTERKYLHQLWVAKYKHLYLSGTLKEQLSKLGKTRRRKMHRKQLQKQYLLQTFQTTCNNEANDSNQSHPNDSDKTKSKSLIETAVISNRKTGSDHNDPCSDFEFAPLSSPMKLFPNSEVLADPKLKQRPVVLIERLDTVKSKLNNIVTRENEMINRKLKNDHQKNYDENVDFISMSDTGDYDPDSDYENISAEEDDTLTCKVCGRPTSQNLLSFHLRTHLSFEEQKAYLFKRRAQNKQTGQNKVRSKTLDNRLDQLKQLLKQLEGRKHIVDRQSQEQPVSKNIVRKRKLPRAKRKGFLDRNYGPAQCTHCGKMLCTIYSLRAHELTRHSIHAEKTYACRICNRPFGIRSHIAQHLATHLNMEEHKQFITWPGCIDEFINRLNSGADLSQPPTMKRRRNMLPPRRLPRKMGRRGRPRKHPYVSEKIEAGGTVAGGQLQTATARNFFSEKCNVSNACNDRLVDTEIISHFSGNHSADTSGLIWNGLPCQDMNAFFVQNS